MDQKVLRNVRTSFEEEYSRELFFEGSWLSRFVKRYSAHLLRRSFGSARTWLWRTAKPYKHQFFCMIINIAPNIDNIVTLLSKIAVTSFISVLIFLSRRWSHLMCTAAHQCEEWNFLLKFRHHHDGLTKWFIFSSSEEIFRTSTDDFSATKIRKINQLVCCYIRILDTTVQNL